MFTSAQKNSTYTTFNEGNTMERLKEKLKEFLSSDLNLIGVKDFYGRTGTEAEYITEDTQDLTFLSLDSEFDTFTISRNNGNVSINYFV